MWRKTNKQNHLQCALLGGRLAQIFVCFWYFTKNLVSVVSVKCTNGGYKGMWKIVCIWSYLHLVRKYHTDCLQCCKIYIYSTNLNNHTQYYTYWGYIFHKFVLYVPRICVVFSQNFPLSSAVVAIFNAQASCEKVQVLLTSTI